MKLLIYILIVQISLNPFLVFIWAGVALGGGWLSVLIALVAAISWYNVWVKFRLVNGKLENQSLRFWK